MDLFQNLKTYKSRRQSLKWLQRNANEVLLSHHKLRELERSMNSTISITIPEDTDLGPPSYDESEQQVLERAQGRAQAQEEERALSQQRKSKWEEEKGRIIKVLSDLSDGQMQMKSQGRSSKSGVLVV